MGDVSSQSWKHHGNMKFHSEVLQPSANILTWPVCCLHAESTGPLALVILCPLAFWTWWSCCVAVTPVTGFLRTKSPPFPRCLPQVSNADLYGLGFVKFLGQIVEEKTTETHMTPLVSGPSVTRLPCPCLALKELRFNISPGENLAH